MIYSIVQDISVGLDFRYITATGLSQGGVISPLDVFMSFMMDIETITIHKKPISGCTQYSVVCTEQKFHCDHRLRWQKQIRGIEKILLWNQMWVRMELDTVLMRF